MNKKKFLILFTVAVIVVCMFAVGIFAEETTIPTVSNSKTITYNGDAMVTYNEQSMTLRAAMLATANAQLADDGETKKYPEDTYPWAVFYKDPSNAIGWRLLKCCKYYLANNQNTPSTADGAVNLNGNGSEAVILLRTDKYNMSSNVNDKYDNLVYNTCAYTVDLCEGTVTCTNTRTFFDMENKSNGGSQVARLMNGTVTDCTLGVAYLRGQSTKTNTSNHDFIFEKLTFNGKMGKLVNCTTSGTNIINHEVEIKNCTFDYSTVTTDIVLLSDSPVSSVKAYISDTTVKSRFKDIKLFASENNKLSETVGEPTVDYMYDHVDNATYGRAYYLKGEDKVFAVYKVNSDGTYTFLKAFEQYMDSTSTKDDVSTTSGAVNYARLSNSSVEKVILLLGDYTSTKDSNYDNFGQFACDLTIDLDTHTFDLAKRNFNFIPMSAKNTKTNTFNVINGTITNVNSAYPLVQIKAQEAKTPSTDYPGVVFANGCKTFNINFTNVVFNNFAGTVAEVRGHAALKYSTTGNVTLKDCTVNSASTAANNLFSRTSVATCADKMTVVLDNTTINATEFDTLIAGLDKSKGDSITLKGLSPEMALALYDNVRPLFREAVNTAYSSIKLSYNGTVYEGETDGSHIIFKSLPLVSLDLIGEKAEIYLIVNYLNSEVMGDVINMSVSDYCYNALEQSDEKITKAEKKLIVDALNYASAAQVWVAKKNNTEPGTLVNAALTEDQKALGTQTAPSVNGTDYSHTGSTDYMDSVAVSLNNGICIRLTSKDYKLRISSVDGTVFGTVSTYKEVEDNGTTYYHAYLRTSAAQLRMLFKFELLDASDNVLETVTNYSFETYAANVSESDTELTALVNAMMNYGDSAKAYIDAKAAE